jgi:hypothetical protein
MTGSGHEVKGGRLRTADADGLDVKRRQSEETVTPIDTEHWASRLLCHGHQLAALGA